MSLRYVEGMRVIEYKVSMRKVRVRYERTAVLVCNRYGIGILCLMNAKYEIGMYKNSKQTKFF